jgi:hypothetical protein
MNIKHSISIVQLSRGRGTAEGSKGRAYFAGVQTPSPQSLAPNSGSEFVASRRLGSPQGERNATKKACHSTKRTHFFGGAFFVYHPYSKMLMSFADGFANGFVLKKRTHFLGGSEGSISLKSGFVSGKQSHGGVATVTSARVQPRNGFGAGEGGENERGKNAGDEDSPIGTRPLLVLSFPRPRYKSVRWNERPMDATSEQLIIESGLPRAPVFLLADWGSWQVSPAGTNESNDWAAKWRWKAIHGARGSE